jgi:hypothetical protein
VELFARALTGPVPNPFPKKDKADRVDVARWFLFRHPDLAQAVAGALTRDAINIAPDKLPADLDTLRVPRGPVK